MGTAWNWGASAGIIAGTYPNRGLVFPKVDERPPFQTREEIERQISGGSLNEGEQEALWECLFLTQPEIAVILDHAKQHSRHGWIYPMICFAAHTGARRSELLRARVTDLDFDGETVLLRECKRVKGRRTTRRAPLSPHLMQVLQAWLGDHPGGPYLFCHGKHVTRSRTRSRSAAAPLPVIQAPNRDTSHRDHRTSCSSLTAKEAHDHFKRTLRGSTWEMLKGWHVFRHSFISCCVAAGVDQRLIDEWVGHTTDEMRKRYRHLVPSTRKQAIRSVFG